MTAVSVRWQWLGSRPAGSGIVATIYKYTRTTEILWRERDSAATLSRGEHSTLALTGFYCFSRPLTSKMVLLYYAKVCFEWLSFTDNKGEDVTKYIKEGYLQCKRRTVWNRLCSIPGRSSSDFGKIKILSKHLLPQGEGVLARASLIAV